MKNVRFALAALLLSAATPALPAPVTLTWTIGGVVREALIFPPAPRAVGGKAPVIFGFHGHGGTMRTASLAMRFQTVWPEAVVVYMQGLPIQSHVDPAGKFNGWQQEPGQVGDRDLKFFDAVLTTIRAKYTIDERRVYVSGFSNGALFSLLLWAERGKELAGIGVCAGVLLGSVHPATPRRVIHIAGEADQIAVYALQVETMKEERAIDGCAPNGQPAGPGATFYPSPANHTPVLTVIHPGGHVYPPWASARIVKFFTE